MMERNADCDAPRSHVPGCVLDPDHGAGCVRQQWAASDPDAPWNRLLDGYDPVPGLVARGVMSDEHDPDSCEADCCVTTPVGGNDGAS